MIKMVELVEDHENSNERKTKKEAAKQTQRKREVSNTLHVKHIQSSCDLTTVMIVTIMNPEYISLHHSNQ